jgi:hypothetical protein
MRTFFRYCLHTGCIGFALMPTAIAILLAGIMIGKPKPCEVTAPCKVTRFSTEVLLLPVCTFVPVLATALYFTVLRRKE